MEWTYYKEVFATGRWALFRSAAGRGDESYHSQRGWIRSSLLFDRQHKGDIDAGDIIPEAEAEELIRNVARDG